MLVQIGGENLVATAFAQLLDLNQDNNSNLFTNELGLCLNEYRLNRYRIACQNYLDNNEEKVFYEVYPDMKWRSFITQKVKRNNYLITLPPLNFIANRNSHIFFCGNILEVIHGDYIFLKKKEINYLREQLKLLFPKDAVATYIMLNKVKINDPLL